MTSEFVRGISVSAKALYTQLQIALYKILLAVNF